MTAIAQRSFAGGELSPALYGRDDQTKYQTGAKQAQNFLIRKSGGLVNRNGTKFISEAPGEQNRLIRFVFNDEQAYLLAFTTNKIRIFYADGTPLTVSRSTQAWVTATPYLAGNWVTSGGTAYYCKVDHTSGASTQPGVGGSWTTYWMALSNWSASEAYYEVALFDALTSADLLRLQYAQSGDIVFFACRSVAPFSFKRYGTTRWVVERTLYYSNIFRPQFTGSVYTSGSETVRYRVTAISRDTLEESLPGFGNYGSIVNISGLGTSGPVTVQLSAAHGWLEGDQVWITGTDIPQIDNHEFVVTNPTTVYFDLAGFDATGIPPFISGGTAYRTEIVLSSAVPPSSTTPVTISWTVSSTILEYDVYRQQNGVYGYVGSSKNGSFRDSNEKTPNSSFSPPEFEPVFTIAGDYPGVVSFCQQRLIYANTDNEPEKVWTSRIGKYLNFSYSNPTQDDDSVQFVLASKKVNEVRHVVDLELPVIFTSTGEWVLLGGGEASVVTPTAINARQKAQNGSAEYPAPVVVDNDIVYVQARGTAVRKFKYNVESDGYKGADLTVYSDHLFNGHQIVALDYQKEPDSVVWAVRNDGQILALTYLPEHEIWGWTPQRMTNGVVTDVCVVPNDDEDSVFFTVTRVVDSVTKYFIEKLEPRIDATEPADGRMVDCHVVFDGRNSDPNRTAVLTAPTNWNAGSNLLLTFSSPWVESGWFPGQRLRIWENTTGTYLDLTWQSTNSASQVIVRAVDAAGTEISTPANHRFGVPVNRFAHTINTITAPHLANYYGVNVVADGAPIPGVYYPNGSGVVTFGSTYYDTIVLGLGYYSIFESLDLENQNGESVRGRTKNLNTVYVLFDKTANNGYIGHTSTSTVPVEPNIDARSLFSKLVEVKIKGSFQMQKRVYYISAGRPVTILGLQPDFQIGG